MDGKPLLAVVETLKNQSLEKYAELLYDPNFWKPLIPVNAPVFEKSSKNSFLFSIDDYIRLDPFGNLKPHFQAEGKIDVIDKGEPNSKGHLWEISVNLENPPASIKVRVRARDLVEEQALKIGIFVQSMLYDPTLLNGIGQEAILFAIRLYLRELIQKAGKML